MPGSDASYVTLRPACLAMAARTAPNVTSETDTVTGVASAGWLAMDSATSGVNAGRSRGSSVRRRSAGQRAPVRTVGHGGEARDAARGSSVDGSERDGVA